MELRDQEGLEGLSVCYDTFTHLQAVDTCGDKTVVYSVLVYLRVIDIDFFSLHISLLVA